MGPARERGGAGLMIGGCGKARLDPWRQRQRRIAVEPPRDLGERDRFIGAGDAHEPILEHEISLG